MHLFANITDDKTEHKLPLIKCTPVRSLAWLDLPPSLADSPRDQGPSSPLLAGISNHWCLESATS